MENVLSLEISDVSTANTVCSIIENMVPKVINFSDYNPTQDELSILKRGFKFCVTPTKPDLLELEIDINEFIRKIELMCFFNSFNSNSESDSFGDDCLVSKKSDFIPRESRDPFLHYMARHYWPMRPCC